MFPQTQFVIRLLLTDSSQALLFPSLQTILLSLLDFEAYY